MFICTNIYYFYYDCATEFYEIIFVVTNIEGLSKPLKQRQ